MIVLNLSLKSKFLAIFLLGFFFSLIVLNHISPPTSHHGRTPHPIFDLFFFSCFFLGTLFVVFNYYWVVIEAGNYKITVKKIWGTETVFFYQDYIIEHLEHRDRYGRAFYSIRFKPFDKGRTFHIPDKLEHFQDLVHFLYKNGKISGE
jgi:hypothetical protein